MTDLDPDAFLGRLAAARQAALSLCPEAAKRAAMTDDELEAHVADLLSPPEVDPYDDHWSDHEQPLDPSPCPLCGSAGACGYDAEGRPMIHTLDPDPED